MSRQILKALLSIMPSQSILLPDKAVMLSVQMHKGQLFLWYECDLCVTAKDEHYIHIYGTGCATLPDDVSSEKYITTIQENLEHVWHIYKSKSY
tara:strand:+ start:305 stop:586 length:282 start_codon:yes stop_codon:yes gene_type:complete